MEQVYIQVRIECNLPPQVTAYVNKGEAGEIQSEAEVKRWMYR